MRERWKVLWKESQKDRETVRREANAAKVVLIQAQELLACSAGMSDAVGCCNSDTAVDCFAFLVRTGQRQLLLAHEGWWEGSFLVYREELIATSLAVWEWLRSAVTFHTGSTGSLGAGSLLSVWATPQGLRAVSADGCVLRWEVGHVLCCSRWYLDGFIRPVLKHGPRSATCMRVLGWKTHRRNESEGRCWST